MSSFGKCCCGCQAPPDILIEGMTGGEWVQSIDNPCCWYRIYTYDDDQDWVLVSDEIIRENRVEYTSVIEYLEFRRDPAPVYRVAIGSGGIPEDCATLPTYPFIDCGTWVKAATRTIHGLEFQKDRQRFWTKQKDIRINYSHSDIACDEHPDTKKFIVQVKQNFWWSFLPQSNYTGISGTGNDGYDSSVVLEPCFGWISGSPPAGFVNSTYPPTESTPWLPPITDPDDATVTLSFVVKTKVYDELPEADIFAVGDEHTLECWSFCADFEQMIRPIDCIQDAVPVETCDCLVSDAQYNIAPTFSPVGSIYTCWYCPDSSGVGQTFTNYPAVTPDCSANSYLIDIVTISCDGDLAAVGLILATHTPLFPKADRLFYNCGPACEALTCASTVFGWHIASNGAEKCSYPVSSSDQTLDSQVSLDLDVICNAQKSDVCHSFITVTLDFNL